MYFTKISLYFKLWSKATCQPNRSHGKPCVTGSSSRSIIEFLFNQVEILEHHLPCAMPWLQSHLIQELPILLFSEAFAARTVLGDRK